MDSTANILQFCRLCLVKDGVNIPIFDEQGDIRQIYLKISSCLPVKVAREDHLPKKICDGCSNKLDICYDFWRTSAESEKQLLAWLGATGKDAAQVNVKEEDNFDEPLASDISKNDDDENKCYMFEQKVEEGPPVEINDEPPPSKRPRRTAAVKAAIAMDQNSDDDGDSGEPITKMEDDSDETDGDDREPAFVDVPSTSADDQPGPSGVSKDGSDAPRKIETGNYVCERDYDVDDPFDRSVKLKFKDVYDRIDRLAVKKRSEVDETPCVCQLCMKVCESKEMLKTHISISHNLRITCNKCGQVVFSLETLRKHLNTHKEMENKKENTQHNCQLCTKILKSEEALTAHIKCAHTACTCDICGKMYASLLSLRNHKSVVHIEAKPYSCTICDKRCKRNSDLKVHLRTHSGEKPYSCDICTRSFINTSNLIKHLCLGPPSEEFTEGCSDERAKDKQYNCPFCTQSFDSKETATSHVNNHNSYVCEKCGKVLCSAPGLKDHMLIHTGEKRFLCALCGKGFRLHNHLAQHLMVHTGEKRFRCEKCLRGFTKRISLKRHKCQGPPEIANATITAKGRERTNDAKIK